MAGTAVISVGLSSVTSPLVPCLILLEVSVMVNGEPYPMAAPAADNVDWETIQHR
jgi:hypothetical protein